MPLNSGSGRENGSARAYVPFFSPTGPFYALMDLVILHIVPRPLTQLFLLCLSPLCISPVGKGWATQPHAATWTEKGLEVRSRWRSHCSPQSLEPKSCTPSAPVLQVYKYFFPFQAISHRILFVFSLVYLQRYLGLILATREHKSFK